MQAARDAGIEVFSEQSGSGAAAERSVSVLGGDGRRGDEQQMAVEDWASCVAGWVGEKGVDGCSGNGCVRVTSQRLGEQECGSCVGVWERGQRGSVGWEVCTLRVPQGQVDYCHGLAAVESPGTSQVLYSLYLGALGVLGAQG